MGRSSVKGGGSMKTTFNQNNFSKVAFCSQNRKTTALKPKHENTRKVQTVRVRRRICDKVMTALISMIVICVAVYIAYRYELADYLPQYKYIRKLKVLIIAPENDKTINHVFENLGYDRVHDINDNWDVLWSTTADPFNLYAEYMTKLKPHQLVNHFPFPPELTHHMSHMIGGGRGSWEFNKKVRNGMFFFELVGLATKGLISISRLLINILFPQNFMKLIKILTPFNFFTAPPRVHFTFL